MKVPLTIAAVTLIAMGARSTLASDWPAYRGPNSDSVVKLDSPIRKLTVTPVWRTPVGDAFGQVAISGDLVAVFAERGNDEFVVALDGKTGKELWASRVDKSIKDGNGNGPRSTPAIDGDRIYCYGTYQKLTCFEKANGRQVWTHDIVAQFGGRPPNAWGNAVSPVVVGDLVITVGGGAGRGILAFRKQTGELAWAKTDESYTQATPTVATIAGVTQVICFMRSGLVSVAPLTGEVLWKFDHPFSTSTAASPVVGGKNQDIVFCSAGYNVGAAACRVVKDGDKWSVTPLWRTERQNMFLWSTPVHRDGFIYGLVGHNDNRGPLACIDIETGRVRWSEPNFGSQGGMMLLGDALLVQMPGGDLLLAAASPEGYRPIDRVNIHKGKNWRAPSFAGSMIYARNSSAGGVPAEVVCLKLVQD